MQPTLPGVPTDQPTVPPREAEPRPAPASVCCCSGLSYLQTPVWAASQARLGSAHRIHEHAPGDGPPPSCKHASLSGPGPGFSQLTPWGLLLASHAGVSAKPGPPAGTSLPHSVTCSQRRSFKPPACWPGRGQSSRSVPAGRPQNRAAFVLNFLVTVCAKDTLSPFQ